MRVTLDTTGMNKCCLNHLSPCYGMLIRHHAGNDGLLKLFSPKIAKEYGLFLDCYHLCDTHHMLVHFMYDLYRDEVTGGWTFNMMTQRQIQEARIKYIELFFRIKSGEVKLKKVSKAHRREWKINHREWLKRTNQQRPSSSRTKGR